MISVYAMCRDKKEAKEISKKLLEKRLIACSNIFPVESLYWWKNRIQNKKEYAFLAKTTKENFWKIKNEIRKMHSYETPCIIALKDDYYSKEFFRWVKKETK